MKGPTHVMATDTDTDTDTDSDWLTEFWNDWHN